MELIYSEIIHNKYAELYKDSDNNMITKYHGQVINCSGKETYLNLRSNEVQSMYLQLCVADYERTRQLESDAAELKDFARGLGWEV